VQVHSVTQTGTTELDGAQRAQRETARGLGNVVCSVRKVCRCYQDRPEQELPSLGSPAQEQGDADRSSEMEIQNIRTDVLR